MSQQSQESNESIHDVVRQRYGAIARSVDSKNQQAAGCCSPSSGSSACCGSPADTADSSGTSVGCGTMYNMEMLEGLPVDVTSLSLGCGDPVSVASLQPGEAVLDLGSGGGIDCFLAAKRVGEFGHVIGVDMTLDMISKANDNKQKMGVKNVEFRLGQIEALPVSNSSIDVIMSNCVINLAPDKRPVFREAFRVLKSGGRISISDIVTQGEFSAELRAQTDKWAECVTGAIDVELYTGMMREAGFTNIQVVDKVSADEIIPIQDGMPRIFSARITARKI